MDFLKLFFTPCLIGMLCSYTKDYANTVGPQKPSLCQSWSNTYPEEFYCFIGLLTYMSIVQVLNIEKYWLKKSLYHGLWARSFMVKKRFKQLMSFLKISNVWIEDPDDKLSKAKFLSGLGREMFCLCSGGTKNLFHSCLWCIMQTSSVLLIEDPKSTDSTEH